MRTMTPLNDRAAYGLPEASLYLRLSYSTLRSWTGGQGVIVTPGDGYLSFNNLLEAHMLKALRRTHRLSMQSVRRALATLSRLSGSTHPLLDASFSTDGISLFLESDEDLINLSKQGQIEMRTVVTVYMHRIERDASGSPIRLFPFVLAPAAGAPKYVSINPGVAFGRSVLAGTGISTAVVAGRFGAGDSIVELAAEYGTTAAVIEDVIRWEAPLKKAA